MRVVKQSDGMFCEVAIARRNAGRRYKVQIARRRYTGQSNGSVSHHTEMMP